MKQFLRVVLPPAAAGVVIVALWELAITVFGLRPTVLPRWGAIIEDFLDGMFMGDYLFHTWITLLESLGGFVGGAIGGILVGVLLAEVRWARRALYPYVLFIQTTPKIAIAPLFLIWLGFGMSSKIAIAASIAFFPIVVNMIVGLNSAPVDQTDLLRAFGASRIQIFFRAKVRASLPYLFAALDVAIVFSVLGAVVGEFVGSKEGLGYLVIQGQLRLDTAQVFSALLLLSLMGLFLHSIVALVQKRVLFWQTDEIDLRQKAV